MTSFNNDPMMGQHSNTAGYVYLTPEAQDIAQVVDELTEWSHGETNHIIGEHLAWTKQQLALVETPVPRIDTTSYAPTFVRPASAPTEHGATERDNRNLAPVVPLDVARRRRTARALGAVTYRGAAIAQ